MNFLALVIISEFDDYFFKTVKTEMYGDLITQKEMYIYNYDLDIDRKTLKNVDTLEEGMVV